MSAQYMTDIIVEITKAKKLKNQLGYRSAAGYLRNRGYSLEASLKILCGK